MDILSLERISAGLGTRWLAHHIIYHESIGSTNDEARHLALADAPEGTLVLAEEQTTGRGRLQRHWLSPAGEALLFSLLLRPDVDAQNAFQLTMLAGLACLHSVHAQTRLRPELKWPNDLLLGGRKLAGILSELGQTDGQLYAVIGIGLNVNVDFAHFPELRARATSLREATGQTVPRLPLLQEILRRFEAGYDQLRAGRSPYEEWASHLSTIGKQVRVVTSEGTFTGRAAGVRPDGALQLALADGSSRWILAGDVEQLR